MPTQKSFQNLRKKWLAQRGATSYREAIQDSKSKAITPEMFDDYAKVFGCKSPSDPASLANILANEHRCFENSLTAAETERLSKQTVVGIGVEIRGRNKGCYPLVLNLFKTLTDRAPGLGFPGGRVHLGETPSVSLSREYREETNLIVEIVNPDQLPVARHLVGEEEHEFLAYEVRIIGGKAKPAFTKSEQIISVVFVDEKLLAKVCFTDGRITVKGFGPVGVLRSHRLAFLEYLRKKELEKTAPSVVEEVANVSV
jgi:ADP-ribose pyrophosphatase YjhB (NUDIX family)